MLSKAWLDFSVANNASLQDKFVWFAPSREVLSFLFSVTISLAEACRHLLVQQLAVPLAQASEDHQFLVVSLPMATDIGRALQHQTNWQKKCLCIGYALVSPSAQCTLAC